MLTPVLYRELNTQSRHWSAHVFRSLAASAGCLVIGGFALVLSQRFNPFFGVSPAQLGAGLFTALHVAACVTLAIFCPLLTADCLSRERREGTLGLLFLTPLTAGGIVAGKAVGQVVRALGLWLAFVPMLMIPLLLGGLTAQDFLRALAVEATVAITALAAGLAASAICRRWVIAVVIAVIFLGMAGGVIAIACDAGFWGRAVYLDPTLMPQPDPRALDKVVPALFLTPFAVNGGAGLSIAASLGGPPPWVVSAANIAIVSELVAAGLIGLWVFRFARRRILAEWKLQSPETAAAERTGRWTRSLISIQRRKRNRAALLDRRPIRWLISRTIVGRLGAWILPGAAVLGWTGLIALFMYPEGPSARDVGDLSIVFPLLLIPPLILFSAGSWRQEIEEGTLELFLVTPLPPERLVVDRARSLWIAFAPTLVFLLLMPLPFLQASEHYYARQWEPYGFIGLVTATSIFALPFCGIRCAFRRLNPITGSVVSALIAFGLPAVLAGMITGVIWGFVDTGSSTESVWCLIFALCQVGVGVAWWRLCVRDLATRGFLLKPFQRAAAGAKDMK